MTSSLRGRHLRRKVSSLELSVVAFYLCTQVPPKFFPIFSYLAMPLALPRFGAVENCDFFSLFAVSCVRHTYMLKMPYQIRR